MVRDTNLRKILEIFKPFYGRSVVDIKSGLSIVSNAKSINNMIVKRILKNSTLNQVEQMYIKENLVLKTVRISQNNTIKEHMSFPTMDYYDILKKDWKNSAIFKYFSQTFILFVFKEVSSGYHFDGIKIWNMPEKDLYHLCVIWDKIKTMLINDDFEIGGKYGYSVLNFPPQKENPVTHIRPHDTNLKKGKALLPSGKYISNYGFWLNNSYLESILLNRGDYRD